MKVNPKVIVLGQSNVGKTSIIQALIQQTFRQKIANTVAAGFHRYQCYNHQTHTTTDVDIWDTAGQEKYRSLLTLYYKNTDGAVIVFDITSQQSFQTVLYWAEQLQTKCQKPPCVLLVGNKHDLKNTSNCIDQSIIDNFMQQKKGWKFMYASAKTDLNIKRIFQQITDMIIKKNKSIAQRQQSKTEMRKILENKKRKDKSCC